MSKAQQSHLFGTPSEDSAQIETDGRTLRPAMALLTPLVDETRLTLSEEGLHARHVDPANVGLLDLTVHPAAFEAFETDTELTVGINVAGLGATVANARMGTRTNDDVTLEIDETRTLVSIQRDYTRHDLTLSDELLNLDPDSIREQPQLPPLNGHLEWSAGVNVNALADVVDHFEANVLRISEADGRLIIGEKDPDGNHAGDYASVGDFGQVADPIGDADPGAWSDFSMDYLGDMVPALKNAKVTDLTLRWGDNVPLALEFARTDDDTTLYEGQFVLSPRLPPEEDDE